MRMRVVKRDFWESEQIGALSLDGRLLLIALWSYVDDNGVRPDSTVSIAAECFRVDLARDTPGTLARIDAGLDELWEAGWITRYSVGGASYLEISGWDFWQTPSRPSKPRYPRSTDAEAVVKTFSMSAHGDPIETPLTVSMPDTEPETETESNQSPNQSLNRGTSLSDDDELSDAEREHLTRLADADRWRGFGY